MKRWLALSVLLCQFTSVAAPYARSSALAHKYSKEIDSVDLSDPNLGMARLPAILDRYARPDYEGHHTDRRICARKVIDQATGEANIQYRVVLFTESYLGWVNRRDSTILWERMQRLGFAQRHDRIDSVETHIGIVKIREVFSQWAWHYFFHRREFDADARQEWSNGIFHAKRILADWVQNDRNWWSVHIGLTTSQGRYQEFHLEFVRDNQGNPKPILHIYQYSLTEEEDAKLDKEKKQPRWTYFPDEARWESSAVNNGAQIAK